jgi:hypothetical protein
MGELQPIKADFNAKIALKNVFFAIILVRQIHNLGNWHILIVHYLQNMLAITGYQI